MFASMSGMYHFSIYPQTEKQLLKSTLSLQDQISGQHKFVSKTEKPLESKDTQFTGPHGKEWRRSQEADWGEV